MLEVFRLKNEAREIVVFSLLSISFFVLRLSQKESSKTTKIVFTEFFVYATSRRDKIVFAIMDLTIKILYERLKLSSIFLCFTFGIVPR